MNRKKGLTLLMFCTIFLEIGCLKHRTYEGLHGALWVQTSAEYQALSLQIFESASARLLQALADSEWSALADEGAIHKSGLPPAIIVDVDETILDNSPYQARLLMNNERYSEDSWGAWVNEASAEVLPGADQFLALAESNNVAVFYVTNRNAKLENATRQNLLNRGLPLATGHDALLMKGENGWGSDKKERRLAVAKQYRVLLLLGDDLNDFVSGARANEPTTRVDLAKKHAERWGREWHLLPNTQYGSWEASLYGRDYSLPDKERRQRKYSNLRPSTN